MLNFLLRRLASAFLVLVLVSALILGAPAQIGLIEDAFRQPSEEPGHAAFQDLAARGQQGGARGDRAAETQKVVLVAARAVEQQEGRTIRIRSGLVAVDEGQFGHGYP